MVEAHLVEAAHICTICSVNTDHQHQLCACASVCVVHSLVQV